MKKNKLRALKEAYYNELKKINTNTTPKEKTPKKAVKRANKKVDK